MTLGRDALLLVAVIAPLSAGSASAAGAVPVKSCVRIVAFGDSTTFGYALRDSYPRQLAAALHAAGWPTTVINAGVNGDTTQGARERFERDVLAHAPDIVLVQFGLNDQTVRLYERPAEVPSYVSEAQFSANLLHFVREAKRRDAQPLLLTSNPMFWSPTLERHYPDGPYLDGPRGGNRLLEQYMDAVRGLGAKEAIPVVDVYAAYSKRSQDVMSPPPGLMMADGVHPTAEGYAVNVDLLLPLLQRIGPATGVAPTAQGEKYFVVHAGRPVCAYVSGRGGQDHDGCFELRRVVHERNPRDAISAPAPMTKRDGRAHLELTAGEGAAWELTLDAARAMRFSTVSGAIQLVQQQPAGAGPAEQILPGPKIGAAPLVIDVALEGAQARVAVDDQTVLTFLTSDEGVGPLELAATAGAVRLQTFLVHQVRETP